MDPQHFEYYEDFYYDLEDCKGDSGLHSEQGAAVSLGGIACDDQQSYEDSENKQGKLNTDQVPDNDLDFDGDQTDQEPMEP